MFRSLGSRFIIVGILAFLMTIPLLMASGIIQDRNRAAAEVRRSVSAEFGGRQVLSGPVLVLPVTATVTLKRSETVIDPASGAPLLGPNGQVQSRMVEYEDTEIRNPVYLLPERLQVDFATQLEERARGIYRVPVYRAQFTAQFEFDLARVEAMIDESETIDWEAAELRLRLSSNRALRGVAELRSGADVFGFDPLSTETGGGIMARPGDPRALGPLSILLEFNGAESLHILPVGRDSHITMASNWPHPSFDGAFLPDRSEVSGDGFTAEWRIPHLARSIAQVARMDPLEDTSANAFGLRFIAVNDFYQKAYRASAYGILFIALTFLTVLLMESRERPAHPVQYILIGLVQSLFVLLMVAYAEHIGFGPAYLLSAGAVAGLITLYSAVGLKLGRGRVMVLGATLTVLYAVLYLVLQSADYALLAGATLAFGALAMAMLATRNEDWRAGGSGGLAGLLRAARAPRNEGDQTAP